MRPVFSTDQLLEIVESLYGMRPVLHNLPSYSDQNVALALDGQKAFVLKIANSDESDEVLLFQIAALNHLADHAPGLKVPRVQSTRSGAHLTPWIHQDSGYRHLVWMVTFIEGRFLVDLSRRGAALLRSLGTYFGRLDRALADFKHPAMQRALGWDLKQAGSLRDCLPFIAGASQRAKAAAILDRYDRETAARLRELRTQVVHNDGNDLNVIVASAGDDMFVSSVIDFGDIVHTALVCEPAIAAAYALLGTPDPLVAAIHVFEGFHKAYPLTETELSIAFDLILLRLCMSVCFFARERTLSPGNPYLGVSNSPAWEALERLTALDRENAADAFVAIVERKPSKKR